MISPKEKRLLLEIIELKPRALARALKRTEGSITQTIDGDRANPEFQEELAAYVASKVKEAWLGKAAGSRPAALAIKG